MKYIKSIEIEVYFVTKDDKEVPYLQCDLSTGVITRYDGPDPETTEYIDVALEHNPEYYEVADRALDMGYLCVFRDGSLYLVSDNFEFLVTISGNTKIILVTNANEMKVHEIKYEVESILGDSASEYIVSSVIQVV